MAINKTNYHTYSQAMHLPETVKIVEVGPRDGLQNQVSPVTVENKVLLINKLAECGITNIEVGSLVSPKHVPQMADSDIVFQSIEKHPEVQYILLLANQQGLDRALNAGVKHISVFCAATDAFSRNNISCTVEQSLANIQLICKQAVAHNISVRAYISCVLGCPYQGHVECSRVGEIASRLVQFGCDEISLGDTIGIGTAGQVYQLIQTLKQYVPVHKLAVHFHDTYGQALANIFVALQSGVHIIDSSVSGLGGCPFAPGASGNVATEDVVYLLNGLGIDSAIDLNLLLSTSWFISHVLNRQPTSKTALAMQSTLSLP